MVSLRRTASSTTVCGRCMFMAGRRALCESSSSALPRIPIKGLFISWRAGRGFGAVCPTQAALDEAGDERDNKVSRVRHEFHAAFSNQANDFRLTLRSGGLDWERIR